MTKQDVEAVLAVLVILGLYLAVPTLVQSLYGF